jgi:hypothetical protein
MSYRQYDQLSLLLVQFKVDICCSTSKTIYRELTFIASCISIYYNSIILQLNSIYKQKIKIILLLLVVDDLIKKKINSFNYFVNYIINQHLKIINYIFSAISHHHLRYNLFKLTNKCI